ncbi:MAG TPA: right-handed parallel beta-helix repeat-containing protein, partial [Gemmataceae bacterium]|nr:right-handed parallel beta-helix repeat-containing protein [Gemmataceae bacterium]
GGNTISDNAGQGVGARSASVLIGDPNFGFSSVNTITGNGNVDAPGGVFGFLGSSLVIRNAVISGNKGFGLGLSLKSDGQLSSSTIQNNSGDGIRLIFGSGLFIAQPNTVVSGNGGFGLQCTDGESSVVNALFLSLSGNGVGDVSGSCTGF